MVENAQNSIASAAVKWGDIATARIRAFGVDAGSVTGSDVTWGTRHAKGRWHRATGL
jgi:hypothetical protein